jgi:hypothetical protein
VSGSVGDIRDDELVLQPFRICELDDRAVALDAEARGPEVECLARPDPPDDGMHETGACAAGCRRPGTQRR